MPDVNALPEDGCMNAQRKKRLPPRRRGNRRYKTMCGKDLILQKKTALGIEFGSTRIKGVLIDYDGNVLATGTYDWENSLIDGIWTYGLDEVEKGLQGCYASLKQNVQEQYGITPVSYGAIGISGMMHGYIALDSEDKQLAPFQTWRNTNTTQAADLLTEAFDFNIPLRWSVAHLCQRMLDHEEHVKKVASVFTLARRRWITTRRWCRPSMLLRKRKDTL